MFEQVEATMQIFSEGMIELSAKVKVLEDSWLQTELQLEALEMKK